VKTLLLKKLGLSLLAVMLVVPMVLIPGPQKADADPAANPAVIREGSTYLLDFETGSLASGTYHDGTSNAFKFSGDTTHISLNDGQLVMGSLTSSTVGVFDYGFSSVPLDKYDNFEVSFDMTMTHRELGKQVGIQFQKNAWNDGWDAQLKTHFTYDGKMNFFEGSTSIANTDAGKYRSLKDYGVPGLNREVMPWETYRVKLVADGNRVQVFMNNHSAPVVDVLRASPVGQGFVGLFGNANTGFKLDNYLFNKLKPEAERDDFALSGDTAGMYVYIPPLNESVTRMVVRYQNLTDAAPGVDYMNGHFALPRGSQSWELRNMIPELETAAVAVRANVEAYAITENPDYIEQAQLWAGRGMPFIYLWDDGSYGIDKANGLGGSFGSHTFMRYGAIAAFGQSTYRSDGKPLPGTWFGRPVQWSGHDFGIALMELYGAMERNGLWNAYLMGGGTDYRTISLGLSVSGSRQTTADDNLYPTHLYDAASLLKWETSDYLYPNYQGAELLGALLGSKTNPITQTVPIGTKEIRISAATDIEVLSTSSASIQLRAEFSSPGSYTIFVQGITSLGNVLPSSNDADAVVSSFAVTSGSGFAEIHLQIGESGETEVNLSSVVLAP
jgi:hypothetical protein